MSLQADRVLNIDIDIKKEIGLPSRTAVVVGGSRFALLEEPKLTTTVFLRARAHLLE